MFYGLNRHQSKLSAMDATEARAYFEKICKTRSKPRVSSISEEVIGEAKLRLRIYKSGKSDAPTMVYFHGGGFAVGSIDSHDVVTRLLCRATGCNVVSVNYRLAPEHPYPAAVQDGVMTLRWLNDQQKLTSDRVLLAGDSAGAQIALQTCLQAKEARDSIKGIIMIYPALDPRLQNDSIAQFGQKHFLTKADMEQFWEAYLPNQEVVWPLAQEQLVGLPPILIQAAEYDILRDEALQFAKDIEAVGGKSEYHQYAQTVHGFMQLPTFISRRKAALNDIASFVRNLL